ncbi:MAG: serine/threonine protein kinase [Myxococcales bacterium]|nr:serine/threonine protein kinase [Myxococcales bacterium]
MLSSRPTRVEPVRAPRATPQPGSPKLELSLPPCASPLGDPAFEERYTIGPELGVGGMGEVLETHDHRIDRQVALKLMLTEWAQTLPDAGARFLREARIQGRLEHPSIVPVYDLGITPAGKPYFVMKRIRGVTLRDVIRGHRDGDALLMKRYTRRKLLTSFAQVCIAVHYAHGQGVIHRDLKPDNIMLGDFGEVYVLDWGVARHSEDGIADRSEAPSRPRPSQILGTPGYMALEQIRDPEQATVQSDIYALGAILFELLALEPLHLGKGMRAKLQSTRAGANARFHERCPDRQIPPELEGICIRATLTHPRARYRSAGELHDAIEGWFDGTRNEKLRQRLSFEHAQAADESVRQIRASGDHDIQTRRRILQQLGRALAFNPQNRMAQETLHRLLEDLPGSPPGVVLEALRDSDTRRSAIFCAIGGCLAFSLLAILPWMLWMGVPPSAAMAALGLGLAVAGVSGIAASRASGRMRGPFELLFASSLLAALSASSLWFGPLVMIPPLLVMLAQGAALAPHPWQRMALATMISIGIAAPLILQIAGLVPPSFALLDAELRLLPGLGELSQAAALGAIVAIQLATLLAAGLLLGALRSHARRVETRLLCVVWHLERLLPASAFEISGPRPAREPTAPHGLTRLSGQTV